MTEKEKQKHNDEKIKEAILNGLIDCRDAPDLGWSNFGGIHIDDCITWLKRQVKQTKQAHFPKFTFDEVLALQCCMETVKKVQEDKELYEKLNLIHSKMYDTYWLEKQGEQEQLYIRFGEIPTDEKSKIYREEIEVGIENGVSVYPAFKTNEGNIVLGLNLPITKTTLHTQQHLVEYDNRPCYLVKGDYIGKDTDGQPLINNVSIIEKIDNYRIKEKIGNIDNQNYKKIEEEKNNVCMNKNIDLTKILKDCPKGWKFYSDIYGEVTFWGFSDLVYPIQLNTKNNEAKLLSEKGEEIIGNGKCILFPSKDQRDWSKFTAPWYKNKFDPKTLQPFNRILVSVDGEWQCDFFSHMLNGDIFNKRCMGVGDMNIVIPYNDDTKHLVGTTDKAPEFYRYWED